MLYIIMSTNGNAKPATVWRSFQCIPKLKCRARQASEEIKIYLCENNFWYEKEKILVWKRFLYEKEKISPENSLQTARLYIDLEKPADTNNKKELCEEVEVNLECKIVTLVFSKHNWEIPGSAACFCCRRAVFQSDGWRLRRSRDWPAPEAAPGSTCGSDIALTHWPSRNMSTMNILSWDGNQQAWQDKVEVEYRKIEDGKSNQMLF